MKDFSINKTEVNKDVNNTTVNNLNINNLNQNNIDEPFKSPKKFHIKILKKVYKYLINIKGKFNKNKKYEIASFILSIIAIIFYILGLEGCYGDEVSCLAKLGLFFYLKIIILNSISSLCACIVLIFITFGKASFFHILYLFPLLMILMNLDQGTNLAHHGYFNTLGYIALLIIFYPISSFVYLIMRLIINKKHYIYMPIFAFIFSLLIFFMIVIKKDTKCDGWDIGLNNTRIYNNEEEYACQINLPKSCYINIWDNKLNISNIIKRDCAKRDDSEKKMLFEYIKKSKNPYVTPNAKRIGYPVINKGGYPQEEQDGLVKLSREVVQNLIDMDNIPPHITEDKIPEVYVDFINYPEEEDSKYGKIRFNLIKNETLVEERKKKSENNNVIFNNIIVLFIDTLSRVHLKRKMPKLQEWLEKFMKYESKDFINYQFLKYHSLGVHTEINLKPAIFGESVLSSNGVSIVNYLKEKGFITGQADDYCSPEPYQLRQSFDHSNVTYGYFDHELISLFCDPNFFRPENPFPINRGNCAILRRCLYGYDIFHHVFNYSKLFWRTYKGSRRFLRLSSMDSHEATGELIKLMDEPLVEFLDDLYKNGDLNDTIIFLFSDHGNHMSPHLSLMPTDDLEMEKVMPFFFILLPKKNQEYNNTFFLDEFYDNLYKNQQSFVNCYDIHDTIIHIIYNEYEKIKAPFSLKGKSLFKRIDDKLRTCDDFPEIYEKRSPGTLTCNCKNNKI